MNRAIPHAIHVALYGTSLATAAAGVGIVHGRVAEPIATCHQGQEVAMCSGQHVDEQELHRHPISLPSEPAASASTPPDDVPSSFWDEGADDEIHQIALPPAPVAEPQHEPHQPDEHGDELIPLPEPLPPGTAGAQESAFLPPVRRASLPNDDFMLGAPRALLDAERCVHAHSVDRDESL